SPLPGNSLLVAPVRDFVDGNSPVFAQAYLHIKSRKLKSNWSKRMRITVTPDHPRDQRDQQRTEMGHGRAYTMLGLGTVIQD
ncbi:hypothetical protein M378DRAFT_159262, partial [Amanita muscaria Koide BX008]